MNGNRKLATAAMLAAIMVSGCNRAHDDSGGQCLEAEDTTTDGCADASDSGEGGEHGGGGGIDCAPDERELVSIEWMCSEPAFAPELPLSYVVVTEVVAGCGYPECKVEVTDDQIVAVVDRLSCLPSSGDGCITTPQQISVGCRLPPLQEGTYSLSINGAPRDTITVTAESDASTCPPLRGPQ